MSLGDQYGHVPRSYCLLLRGRGDDADVDFHIQTVMYTSVGILLLVLLCYVLKIDNHPVPCHTWQHCVTNHVTAFFHGAAGKGLKKSNGARKKSNGVRHWIWP